MGVLAHPLIRRVIKVILEEETYKKYGYYPRDLKPKSSKKPILAKCDGCGIIRETTKNDYHNLCRSCVCASMKGKNNPNWQGGKVKRTCLECGKEFEVNPSVLKRGRGKFCSHSCASKVSIRMRRHNTKPKKTRPERIFEDICKRNKIDFQYTGDGTLWIGKKGQKQLNPDFIAANGKKICVEIFGDYWHSPLLNRNMKKHGSLEYRRRHFKRFKWHPIFIWEADLLREDAELFILKSLKKEEVM